MVTTLTFQGHVTSSVTWPFDSQVLISYRRSIVTKSLSPTVSEILAFNCFGVTTLTFQGHVTSSVTWPLDSWWSISYWWSFEPKSLSLTVSEIFRLKHHVLIEWRNAKSSLRMRDITWCVVCKIWVHISIYHPHFAYSICHFHWATIKNKGCSLSVTSNVKGQIERKIFCPKTCEIF